MVDTQTTTPDAPELLTLPQCAKLCNVSQRTLWGWATSGTAPPALRIGKGVVRYSRRAYETWVSNGCQPCNGKGVHHG